MQELEEQEPETQQGTMEPDPGEEENQLPLTDFVKELIQPVSSQSPCGENVRYGDDFPALKLEADKRGANDYQKIVELSRKILIEQSKDLWVACYLCVGLFAPDARYRDAIDQTKPELTKINEDIRIYKSNQLKVDEKGDPKLKALIDQKNEIQSRIDTLTQRYREHYRFNGLADGLRVLFELMINYWDNLFPEKMVVRQKALTWLLDNKLKTIFSIVVVKPEARAALEKIAILTQRLKLLSNEKFPENPPPFLILENAVNDQFKKLPPPEPEPEPGTAEVKQSENDEIKQISGIREDETKPETGKQALGSSQDTTATSLPDKPEILIINEESQAIDALNKVIAYLKTNQPGNALPYRISRIQKWGSITKKPGIEKENRTRFLPSLTVADYQNEMEKKIEEQNWLYILNRSETMFGNGSNHFWLDLQRYIDTAATQLGATYKNVINAVRMETGLLLLRVPDLIDLAFQDGTPFADNVTKNWIDQFVMPMFGGNEQDSETDGKIAAEFNDAKNILLSEQNLSEALHHIQQGMATDSARKSVFRRRLNMAILCIQKNQFKMALPLLSDLDKEIEGYALHEWEPQLCLEVWTHLKNCYDKLANSSEDQNKNSFLEHADKIFEKICRIDVRKALQI